MRALFLIRHGRSSHIQTGWIDRQQFLQWRERYEAAGIRNDDLPPQRLRDLVAGTAHIVASDTRRAAESARALAADREVVTSPLLRELELHPPHVGPIRLPMIGWGLAYGVRSLVRALLRRPHLSPAEAERVEAAVNWIEALVHEHGTVAVVTHASLRAELARRLVSRGWQNEIDSRLRHWSSWTLVS